MSLAEQLRPQCDEIIAQYEEKRSALLPIAHLFQAYSFKICLHFSALEQTSYFVLFFLQKISSFPQ